ncbi:patatin-like phospholipase family protein [Sphaerisporangium sp. NBC_01403]|uniref:patatin-like phospholipase family protein n=1 Tax=Sphaerisporangium sp. NBC_01403 TaxID=2903599 RepID=UPI0032527F9E
MKAFVLWGAGSLGAAQVGMLRALTENGIRADLVVGASVGALNAAHYATHPSPAGVEELAGLWLPVGRHDVYPLSLPEMAQVLVQSLPWHPLHGALRALGALNYAFPVNPLTIEAAIQLVPVFAQLGSWGLRHRPTSNALNARAVMLEQGGPPLWQEFMTSFAASTLAPNSQRDHRVFASA